MKPCRETISIAINDRKLARIMRTITCAVRACCFTAGALRIYNRSSETPCGQRRPTTHTRFSRGHRSYGVHVISTWPVRARARGTPDWRTTGPEVRRNARTNRNFDVERFFYAVRALRREGIFFRKSRSRKPRPCFGVYISFLFQITLISKQLPVSGVRTLFTIVQRRMCAILKFSVGNCFRSER